uniref:Ssu-2 homolog n=1 Tax=Anabas testudineus TaxID=64144 RepID=A0A7N6AWE2_ANATE
MMNSAAMYPPLFAPAANIPGYGDYNVSGGYLPPPMPTEPIAPQPGSIPSDWSIPALTEDEARHAFKDFVSSHCCYSSSPADDGVITAMEPHNTYRYRLETFTEARSTDWAHKPYEGEVADHNPQQAPQPWTVHATPPNLFTDHTQEIRLPFTSIVKKSCSVCNGSGKNTDGDCTNCSARGKVKCSDCKGEGMKDCKTCKGTRRLLAYIQLKVEWKNHVEDYTGDQNPVLKSDKLRSANGKELYKNNQFLLYPLIGFPNPAMAQASERLIKDHQSKFSQTSRILQQRQTVELIPITKVVYAWKGKSHFYVVYGNNNKVSDDDYPATCCCTIL